MRAIVVGGAVVTALGLAAAANLAIASVVIVLLLASRYRGHPAIAPAPGACRHRRPRHRIRRHDHTEH